MKKNNDEILYNSISNIDENIIASSLVYKPKSKKIIIWASLAACLCAVSVTYAVIYKNNFNKPVNNSEVLSTTNRSSDFHIYSLPKVLSENSENSKQMIFDLKKRLNHFDKICNYFLLLHYNIQQHRLQWKILYFL